MYSENSKDFDEVGFLGFSILESGFHKTKQELVSYPKMFKNDWLSLLFPSNIDENKSNQLKKEQSLNLISHEMNIIRVKMIYKSLSIKLEDKIVKENPPLKIIFDELEKQSDDFCIPIYVYLMNNIRFRLGFTSIEKGENSIHFCLTSDIKIRSS